MRLVLVGGSTATARIDGISAAGADPDLLAHTPSADMEILAYGRPIRSPVVPVSPSGCPTLAVITRAARELLGFDLLAVDAGLARPTGAPTVDLGDDPDGDVRDADPVPDATFAASGASRPSCSGAEHAPFDDAADLIRTHVDLGRCGISP